MNAGRLLVVYGAGLSMAPPSSLPSARTVAERCFDKYQLEVNAACDIDVGPAGAMRALTAADVPPMPVGVQRSGLLVVGA